MSNSKKKYPKIIKEIRGSGAIQGIFFYKQFELIQSLLKKIDINFLNNNRVFISKIFIAALIEKLYAEHKILAKLGEKSLSSSESVDDLSYLSIDPSLIIQKSDIQYFFKSLDAVLSEGVYKINFEFISNILKKKLFSS